MFTGLNTPEDYLRVIKNHRWMIVLPIVISVCLAGGHLSMVAKELSCEHADQL